MNFLAHLFLSKYDDDLLIGNFIADFIRKKDDVNYSQGIQRGLTLHRKIDTFTDNHAMVRESTRLLHERHHKYSPVILDVYYDYLLAKNWEAFSKQSLSDFTQNVYKTLESNLLVMPPVLQHRLPLMIADDWLTRYGTFEGLEFTFNRMKRRASQPSHFDNAGETLQMNLDFLDENFRRFFPDAIHFVFNLQNEAKW